MKSKVNLIVVLVMLLVVFDFADSFFYAKMGWNDAQQEQKHGKKGQAVDSDPSTIYLIPTDTEKSGMTVTNSSTGKQVQVWGKELIVNGNNIEKADSKLDTTAYSMGETTGMIVKYSLTALIVASFIVVMFNLFRFVVHINERRIVDAGNVKILRKLGIWLMAYALANTFYEIAIAYDLSQMIQIEGYVTNYFKSIYVTPMMLSLIAFLVAEILKMANKLKEEQELTI